MLKLRGVYTVFTSFGIIHEISGSIPRQENSMERHIDERSRRVEKPQVLPLRL